MDLAFIQQLLDLVGRAPITELELAKDGWCLRVSKAGPGVVAEPARAGVAGPIIPPTAKAWTIEADAKAHTVVAGITGTFYRRPAPDKPAFVAVGDAVEDGQALGIIEAMKVLVAIEADQAGVVAAILADDGAAVAVGQPLFTMAPVTRP